MPLHIKGVAQYSPSNEASKSLKAAAS